MGLIRPRPYVKFSAHDSSLLSDNRSRTTWRNAFKYRLSVFIMSVFSLSSMAETPVEREESRKEVQAEREENRKKERAEREEIWKKKKAELDDSLKEAQVQLMESKEIRRKSCEDMKTKILQSSDCSAQHAVASAINCSDEGESHKKAYDIFSSCVKAKKIVLTKEQKEKLREAIADSKKNLDEVVKCEAFDEQDVSAGSLDAKRKDCSKMLENKIIAERCMPGPSRLLKYKFTAGSDKKKTLLIFCKK